MFIAPTASLVFRAASLRIAWFVGAMPTTLQRAALPGLTGEALATSMPTAPFNIAEEAIAAKTQEWFNAHQSPAKPGGGNHRKPSLSQWLDLVGDLDRGEPNALTSRLNPTTAGGKSWKHGGAEAVLNKHQALQQQRALHARLIVRWLRADLRARQARGSR